MSTWVALPMFIVGFVRRLLMGWEKIEYPPLLRQPWCSSLPISKRLVLGEICFATRPSISIYDSLSKYSNDEPASKVWRCNFYLNLIPPLSLGTDLDNLSRTLRKGLFSMWYSRALIMTEPISTRTHSYFIVCLILLRRCFVFLPLTKVRGTSRIRVVNNDSI